MSFLVWIGAAGLWFAYDRSRPTVPQLEAGREYALNTHGHTVYLNLNEAMRLYGLMVIGFGGMMAAITCSRGR